VLDQFGNATLIVKPDTGQFWLPTITHVGNRSGMQMRCGLHSGGVAAATDPTTLKDFTFQGYDDTSSILSGTVISYGEAISAQFQAGTPGDVVFLEVVGLSSDLPPPLGILPSVPGARFVGSTGGVSLTALLAFGSVIVGTQVLGNPLDTSQRSFLGVRLFSNVNHGLLQLEWFNDQALTQFLTVDQVNIRQGGVFDQSLAVKGNFVRITVVAGSAGNWTITLLLYETSTATISQLTPTQNVLASRQFNVNAGATDTFNVPNVMVGPAFFYANASIVTTWFVIVSSIDHNGNLTRLYTVGNALGPPPIILYLPATNIQIALTNLAAFAGLFEYALTVKPLYP